jgi:hypothetical protein
VEREHLAAQRTRFRTAWLGDQGVLALFLELRVDAAGKQAEQLVSELGAGAYAERAKILAQQTARAPPGR